MNMSSLKASFPYAERDRYPVMCYPMPWQAPNLETVYDAMGLGQPSHSKLPKAMYMHIPFCEYLCGFCPFVKYMKDEERVRAYLGNLKAELRFYAQTPYFSSATFGSLYMGGGTASCLSSEQIFEIVTLCRSLFNFEPDAEITLESNPKTVSLEKFSIARSAGVNRVSFGVQTFNDSIGTSTDVAQDGATSKQAIRWAQQAGINNISIDLIYNLPGQTTAHLQQDLEEAIAIGLNHMTLFPLSVMPHTLLFRWVQDNEVSQIGALEHEYDLIQHAGAFLSAQGFSQTTVPDFARSASDYRHVQIHFRDLQDLLGVGAGAMGCVNDYSYVNVAELPRYHDITAANLPPINVGQQSPAHEKPRAAMTMGLRMLQVERASFRERFGHDPEHFFGDVIERLVQQDLLETTETSVRLTELGAFFGYNVAKEFYSPDIRERGQRLAEALARKRDAIPLEERSATAV